VEGKVTWIIVIPDKGDGDKLLPMLDVNGKYLQTWDTEDKADDWALQKWGSDGFMDQNEDYAVMHVLEIPYPGEILQLVKEERERCVKILQKYVEQSTTFPHVESTLEFCIEEINNGKET
jgi:hypothetical protein